MKSRATYSFVILFLMLISSVIAEDTIQSNGPETASYTLSWKKDGISKALVSAKLYVTNGRLMMTDKWSTFFESPDGWAQFINGFEVKNSDGEELPVSKEQGVTWTLHGFSEGIVDISYEIDFRFAYEKWSAGNEQVALIDENSLYTTTLPLFIYTESVENAAVEFKVPEGWFVSTPWRRLNQDSHVYSIHGLQSLINNCLMVGKHTELRLNGRNFDLVIGLMGDIGTAREVLIDGLLKHLNYYVDLFDYRDRSSYFIAMIPGPEDGESYTDSFASSTVIIPSEGNIIIWGNNIGHEFFHFWNGRKINTDFEHRAERQWFSEGFTEYFANLSMIQNSMIPVELYLRKLEKHLGMYLLFRSGPFYREVSLRKAGERKWHYRPGVYSGGVAVAACLDVLIHEKSAGTRSLKDLMRLMYERFGKTGIRYRYSDIVSAVSEVMNEDMSEFFEKYIEGTERLPFKDVLERAGFKVLVDGYDVFIDLNGKATPPQRNLRRLLIGQ